MTDVAIRTAQPDDVAEVARLVGLMFESWGPVVDDPDWGRSVESAVVEGIGSTSVVLVIDDLARPGRLASVGAGVVDRRLPRPGVSYRRAGYIQWISTDPSCQRQGHATRITQALLDWFTDQGVHRVELHATEAGSGVYRALGFKEPTQVSLRWQAEPT